MGYLVHDRKRHWPNPVPYRLDSTVVATTGAKSKLDKAIAAWNKASPLKLTHDQAKKAPDYISFGALKDGGGGGWSESVGRKGGKQWVWADFGLKGSEMTNLLLHEIGHAVGLIHEHQRPDRDAFITRNRVPAWDVKKQGNINVDIHGQAVGPYDCRSLMHYLDRDPYVDPKPGRCTSLSNTKGLTDGDATALSYLAGQRYRILHDGTWSPAWSHVVPFEFGQREHLVVYASITGVVRFDEVVDGGVDTKNKGTATWAKIWDVVLTFEVEHGRFLLVYDRGSGAVRIDRIDIDPATSKMRSLNVWAGTWAKTWGSVVALGLEGYQRDHIMVYDPGSGKVRIDMVNRGEKPGAGTTNVWERKWRAGYTTVMPFRLGDADWYVLVYHKGDGKGFVYRLTKSGYSKVQEISWAKGWTHFVPYAQHSAYSYHQSSGPEPSARFLAYRRNYGTVHFDRMFKKRSEILGTDTWGKGWDILTPIFRGDAGQYHLGNDGLIAYDFASGQVHFDQLL